MAYKLPPLPAGIAPGSGYWNDWYEKLRTLVNNIAAGLSHNLLTGLQGGSSGEYYHLTAAEHTSIITPPDWSEITGTPTTIAGYGIVDALSTGRTISTSPPLSGGGDLTVDRTLSITEFSGSSPGSVPTSLGGTSNFLRADGVWATPVSGSSSWTEVEIDFGTSPTWDKTFTIIDAAISSGDTVIVVPSGNPATGRFSDDWQWDSLTLAAIAGTGNFTLYTNTNGPVEGKRNIYYQVV